MSKDKCLCDIKGYVTESCNEHAYLLKEIECPQCVRFREKLDREKMAKLIHRNDHECAESLDWWKEQGEARETYRRLADALIKYLTE